MAIIVITGNPVDGFAHYGPFDSLTDELAEQFEGDWWVTTLHELDGFDPVDDDDENYCLEPWDDEVDGPPDDSWIQSTLERQAGPPRGGTR